MQSELNFLTFKFRFFGIVQPPHPIPLSSKSTVNSRIHGHNHLHWNVAKNHRRIWEILIFGAFPEKMAK